MPRLPEPALAGERRTRLATLITLIVLFSGGAFLAWRAVHPAEAQLPPDIFAALERIATLQNVDTHSSLPDILCAPTLDLSIISFIILGDSLASIDKTKPQKVVFPDIAQRITATVTDSLFFSHLQAQDSVVYLDIDSIPYLEKATRRQCSESSETSEEDEGSETCSSKNDDGKKMATTRLSSRQLSTLGWHLYSQLPPPSSTPGTVRALVLVTPPEIRSLEAETTSSSYSNLSYKVAENLLLVLVPATVEGEEEEATDFNDIAAEEILNWLSAYTPNDDDNAENKETSSNIGSSNTASQQCISKAAGEISKFLKILNIAPELGIKVTSDVAQASHAAVTAFNTQGLDRLKHSRIAWGKARALAAHSDLGATPQLPSEHVLALLLPIGLPIFLAIVQAVGKEVKETKRRRLVEEEKKKT